jgi:anti-sigma factor ChrR (cupin superfamily)
MTQGLNTDFSRFVVMHTDAMKWQASPSKGVWRKRLDLAGDAEKSRVTSVVRYDPGSRFAPHPHPDGEEILVLEGVFSDESVDYPAGSFLLNPEGFVHAPFSLGGCTLFVKLRQYPGAHRHHFVVDGQAGDWRPGHCPGAEFLPLYHEEGHRERIDLVRLQSATLLPARTHPRGAELFVLEGDLADENAAYRPGSWARFPPGTDHCLSTEKGARFYWKRGHLP